MEKAVGTLRGYSFLARQDIHGRAGSRESEQGENAGQVIEAEEMYDIHRLVHLATRIWVKKHGDAGAVGEDALRHVADIFPSADHKNIW